MGPPGSRGGTPSTRGGLGAPGGKKTALKPGGEHLNPLGGVPPGGPEGELTYPGGAPKSDSPKRGANHPETFPPKVF